MIDVVPVDNAEVTSLAAQSTEIAQQVTAQVAVVQSEEVNENSPQYIAVTGI